MKNWMLTGMAVLLLLPWNVLGQNGPVFVTMTTMHWNWKCESCTPERWLELEKAYFDKVTAQNEKILASGVYNHLYSEDNSEVVFVNVHASWEDIMLANDRNNELLEAAWPDQEERDALQKERNRYYQNRHEDEIMMSLPQAMPLAEVPEVPLVYLAQTRHLAFPEDADMQEYQAMWREFHQNVTHKNPLLKAFYPHRHVYGSDGRDVMNVFAFASMEDAHRFFDEQQKLIEAYWPDPEARKEFFQKFNRYFTPWHSDRFLQNVPELHKLRHVAGEAEE